MAPTVAMATILVREGIFDMILLLQYVLLWVVWLWSILERSRGVPLSQPCRCGGGTARVDDVVITVQRLLLCSNLASAKRGGMGRWKKNDIDYRLTDIIVWSVFRSLSIMNYISFISLYAGKVDLGPTFNQTIYTKKISLFFCIPDEWYCLIMLCIARISMTLMSKWTYLQSHSPAM